MTLTTEHLETLREMGADREDMEHGSAGDVAEHGALAAAVAVLEKLPVLGCGTIAPLRYPSARAMKLWCVGPDGAEAVKFESGFPYFRPHTEQGLCLDWAECYSTPEDAEAARASP